MTKRRTILAILLGAIMALCLSFAVACGGGTEGDTSAVKWIIEGEKDHVTVMVDGKTDLPASYTVGETLKFTVTPETGYEVTVKVGRSPLNEKNGVYSYTVKKGDTEITINVSKKVKGVSVTTKPSTMTYYAGEKVDPTGMVVTVEYETGTSEPVTAYTIDYPNGSGYFALGDTSFTVTYGSKTSPAVTLDAAVVGKVTIDPQGGKIADSYKTALEANEELENVKVDAQSGVLTFTFAKALMEAVDLPAASEMSRGVEGDYTFDVWNDGSVNRSSVPAELALSVTYTARWNAKLLDLEKIYFGKGEKDGAEIPLLAVEGKFRAATSAYLYLYEGKAQVEMKGDAVGDANTKRGDKFTLKFDMTPLSAAEYLGKYMDIKFVAEADGVKDTQEIKLSDYAGKPDFYKKDDAVVVDGYRYHFEEYSGLLKACAGAFTSLEYTISVKNDNTDDITFVFSGKVNESIYFDKTAVVDFYIGSTKPYYGVIGADGSFTVEVPLKDWPLGEKAFAHFSIVESQQNTTKLFPTSGEYNLPNVDCKNTDFADNGKKAYDVKDGYLLTEGTIFAHNADYTKVFYIGPGKWAGIIAYGYNEKASLEVVGDVALKVDSMENPAKVYYVVKVAAGGRIGYTKEQLLNVKFGNIDGSTTVYDVDAERSAFLEENGKVTSATLWFDVTAYSGSMLWSNLYQMTAGADGAAPTYDKLLEIKDADRSVNGLYAIAGGKKYSILCTTEASGGKQNTWNGCNLIVETTTETQNPESADPEYVPPLEEYTVDMLSLKFELKDGKPTFTIGGTVSGYTKDNITFELETNGEVHTSGGWQKVNPPTTVTIEGNKYTITVDLSEVGLHSVANNNGVTQFLMHVKFGTNTVDIESNFEMPDANGTSLEYNGLYYTLIIRKAQTWNRSMWQLVVSEEELAAPGAPEVPESPEIVSVSSVELSKDDSASKAYMTVALTVKNYTQSALQAIKLGNVDGSVNVKMDCVEAKLDGTTATLKFDITSFSGKGLYCNIYDGSVKKIDLKLPTKPTINPVTLGTKTYSVTYSQWNNVLLNVEDTAAPTLSFKNAELKNEGEKLYFVLKADSTKYTVEQLKTIKFFNGDSKLSVDETKSTFTANGESALYFDVTSLNGSAGGVWFWGHIEIDGKNFDGGNGDLKPTGTVAETTFEYGGKEYHLTLNGGTQLILIIKTKA